MTFEEYKQFVEENFGECDVLLANCDYEKKNCGEMSGCVVLMQFMFGLFRMPKF